MAGKTKTSKEDSQKDERISLELKGDAVHIADKIVKLGKECDIDDLFSQVVQSLLTLEFVRDNIDTKNTI